MRLAVLAAWFPLLALAACGGGGDDSSADLPTGDATETSDTTAQEGLLPCTEDRHMVAVDILGFLTVENLEAVGPWVEEGIGPTPRDGAVAFLQAYRERGYELLYITTVPPDVFPGRTSQDVVTEWLQSNGFPTGEGAHVWTWDGVERDDQQTWISITDELLRLAGEGVSIDAAYTENQDKSYAFATGGVPAERNFSFTPVEGYGDAAPTSAPTTLIPNDDLVAHTATVEQLPPVCQIG